MTQNCCRECWLGDSAAPWPSTHWSHLSTWAKHLLLQCPVILLTSKLPNICTHIHEYNIQKCSKVIWKIRNIPTNNRCKSSCRKQVTQTPGRGCVYLRVGGSGAPLLPGTGHRGKACGDSFAVQMLLVVQLRATSAPQQNNLTREGNATKKLWTHKNNLHETCLGHSSTSTASQCYWHTHQVTRE